MSRQHVPFSKSVRILLLWQCALAAICFQSAYSQSQGTSGVAVLNDGRVFQGTVQEVPGGYRVQYPGGSSILPFDQISVTSATMVGAYEAFRDSIRTPSADAHLRLAEWCLANGLYAQADIEVQTALKLEPMRSDAKAILKQVDAVLRPQKLAIAQQPAQVAPPPRAAINVAAFTSPAERNGTGLTREAQLEYMRKVQPLLINKCGNAGCHGPNVDNLMRLKNARHDSPGLRLATEHNLAVVFSMINSKEPDQSPLLIKPREATPVHQNLFFGVRQQGQFEILDNWVHQVSRERDPEGSLANVKSKPGAGGPSRMTLIQSGHPVQQAAAEIPVTVDAPATLPFVSGAKPIASPNNQPNPATASDLEFLDRIRQSHRPDAFDPDEFNRMMHTNNAGR